MNEMKGKMEVLSGKVENSENNFKNFSKKMKGAAAELDAKEEKF